MADTASSTSPPSSSADLAHSPDAAQDDRQDPDAVLDAPSGGGGGGGGGAAATDAHPPSSNAAGSASSLQSASASSVASSTPAAQAQSQSQLQSSAGAGGGAPMVKRPRASGSATASSATDVQLPLARVKRIVKADRDIKLIGNDASVLVAKATELFLASLTSECVAHIQSERRKVIHRRDIVTAINQNEHFEFLADIIPPEGSRSSGKQSDATPKRAKPAAAKAKGYGKQQQLSFK